MKTIHHKIIVLLVSLAFLTACGNKTEQADGQSEVAGQHEAAAETSVDVTQKQYEIAAIVLGNVEMRNISGTIQANGMLDVPPQSKVTISAPMGGFVKETELLPGSRVKKGEVVVVMENIEYIQLQQDYLDLNSQLEYLKAEYNRQQELAKENINAQKTLQQSKSAYQSMDARVKGIRAKMKMLNIDIAKVEKGELQQTIRLTSSIAGFVTKVNVNIGAYVNPADVMFEIVNTEHLHAELTVFEKDVPKLKIGQKVLFTLANEDKPRKATVHLIGREINKDRSVEIHCHLDYDDPELIPGTYLRALVETNNNNVKAVPEQAIVHFEGKDYIFSLKQGDEKDVHKHTEGEVTKTHEELGKTYSFDLLEVVKGNTELGFSEITLPEDFNMKNKIVVKGGYHLLAKMKNSEEEE